MKKILIIDELHRSQATKDYLLIGGFQCDIIDVRSGCKEEILEKAQDYDGLIIELFFFRHWPGFIDELLSISPQLIIVALTTIFFNGQQFQEARQTKKIKAWFEKPTHPKKIVNFFQEQWQSAVKS